jgi:hypothetical protein
MNNAETPVALLEELRASCFDCAKLDKNLNRAAARP